MKTKPEAACADRPAAGREFARGVTEFSAEQIGRIRGRQSADAALKLQESVAALRRVVAARSAQVPVVETKASAPAPKPAMAPTASEAGSVGRP